MAHIGGETDVGFGLVVGDVAIYGGDLTPWETAPDAVQGSFFFQTSGEIFKKISTGVTGSPTEWEAFSQPVGSNIAFYQVGGVYTPIPLMAGGLLFTLADGVTTVTIPLV